MEEQTTEKTRSRRAAASTQLLPKMTEEVGEGNNIFAQGSGENQRMNAALKHESPPIFTPVNFVIVDNASPRNASAWNREAEAATGATSNSDAPAKVPAPPRRVLFYLAGGAVVAAIGLAYFAW